MKTFYEYLILVESDDSPTEIVRGSKRWLNSANDFHRIGGPAIETDDGIRIWYLNGKLHRTDGPAYERKDEYKEWWVNNELHREDGPAMEFKDGTCAWYIHHREYSKEEYYEKMKEEIIKKIEGTEKIGETTVSNFGFDEKDAWDNPLTLALADYLENEKNDSDTANQIRRLMEYWGK